jgi:biotin synthase
MDNVIPQSERAIELPRWTVETVVGLFDQPFNDLLYQAHSVHRAHFEPNTVQLSTLLNIKTGGCPEDCSYCSQSAHNETELVAEKLMTLDEVMTAARAAKEAGTTRFCMGAAWRSPKDRDLDKVIPMIEAVRDMGMESCVTLGMVTRDQAQRLKDAGLDYYNHNIDTSEAFYGSIITTRTYDDRLETLANLRTEGIKLCSGGIVGMGESREDRASMLCTLANLPEPPESVPVNMLVPIAGTPLQAVDPIDPLEFVRTIAVTRILMPSSYVRLSAGRAELTREAQAMCFFAGANSIFYGEKLLTTENADVEADRILFTDLGLMGEQGRVDGKLITAEDQIEA